jgi:hypothetical protein
MSEHTEISGIFARQRAERERRQEEERREKVKAQQTHDLALAFSAVSHCEEGTLPPGADFFPEFAARLTRLAWLLSFRGLLEYMLGRVAATRETDGPHERDARAFVVHLMREANAGNQETVAGLLREAEEQKLPFGLSVNGWLRYRLHQTMLDLQREEEAPALADGSAVSQGQGEAGNAPGYPTPVDIILTAVESKRTEGRLRAEAERRRHLANHHLRRVPYPPGCERAETNHSDFWTAEGWTGRFLEAAAALQGLGVHCVPASVRADPRCVDAHRVSIYFWGARLPGRARVAAERGAKGQRRPDCEHRLAACPSGRDQLAS